MGKTVSVPVSAGYEVEICPGVLEAAGRRVRQICPLAEKVLVVTDDLVGPLWKKSVLDSLAQEGLAAADFILPHGERAKTAENLVRVLNFAAGQHMTRTDVFLALGGGVVGDLTGFAAAIYLRGVAYIQAPTTLLAAVDSSVGGKTGVDLPAGKNLIGAFWQPRAVLCDTRCLDTLPEAVFLSGCAEVIKTAVLFDEDLFRTLDREGPRFQREEVIARCVEYKRDVVVEDERDTGRRALLNLGHTLGHAVEACSGFTLSHGQAVAIGMAAVTRAAAAKGLCSRDLPRQLEPVLAKFSLPVRTEIPLDALMERMESDKKRSGRTIRLVVPRKLGECELLTLTTEEVRAWMEEGLKP